MLAFRASKACKSVSRLQTVKGMQYLHGQTKEVGKHTYCQYHQDQYYDQHEENHVLVPKIGQEAPAFTAQAVVNGQFKTVSLSDYAGKYVYLFFYPLDFTFVCPTEICSFSDRAKEFRDIGCEVIGISIDSHFSHLAWTKLARSEGGLGKLDIPLVADLTKEISQNYGALFLDKGFSLRASYLIGPTGVLRHVTMNEPPVGRSVDEALRVVQAFKQFDEVGEVCPVNWKPGQDTMAGDVEKSKTWFKKHGGNKE